MSLIYTIIVSAYYQTPMKDLTDFYEICVCSVSCNIGNSKPIC